MAIAGSHFLVHGLTFLFALAQPPTYYAISWAMNTLIKALPSWPYILIIRFRVMNISHCDCMHVQVFLITYWLIDTRKLHVVDCMVHVTYCAVRVTCMLSTVWFM